MKAAVNALTLALIERFTYDTEMTVNVARDFATEFFAENADLFTVEPPKPYADMPVAMAREPKRFHPAPPEPDADDWLAQTSAAALRQMK